MNKPPWEASCSIERGIKSCGVPILFHPTLETPLDVPAVDVLATVTLSYTTSRRDWGAVLEGGRR